MVVPVIRLSIRSARVASKRRSAACWNRNASSTATITRAAKLQPTASSTSRRTAGTDAASATPHRNIASHARIPAGPSTDTARGRAGNDSATGTPSRHDSTLAAPTAG